MKAKYFSKSEEEKMFFSVLKQRVHEKLKSKTISYGDARFGLKVCFGL